MLGEESVSMAYNIQYCLKVFVLLFVRILSPPPPPPPPPVRKTICQYLLRALDAQPEKLQTWSKLWMLTTWCKFAINLHQACWQLATELLWSSDAKAFDIGLMWECSVYTAQNTADLLQIVNFTGLLQFVNNLLKSCNKLVNFIKLQTFC